MAKGKKGGKGGGFYMAGGGGRGYRSDTNENEINLDDVSIESRGEEGDAASGPYFKDERGFLGRIFRPNSAERLGKGYELNRILQNDTFEREKAYQSYIMNENEKILQERQALEDEAAALAVDAVVRSQSPFSVGESEQLNVPALTPMNNRMRGNIYQKMFGQGPYLSGIPEQQQKAGTARRAEQTAQRTHPYNLAGAENKAADDELKSRLALQISESEPFQRNITRVTQQKPLMDLDRKVGDSILTYDGTIFTGSGVTKRLIPSFITDPNTGKQIPTGEFNEEESFRPPMRFPAANDQGFAAHITGSQASPNVPGQPVLPEPIEDMGPAPTRQPMLSDEATVDRIRDIKPSYAPQLQRGDHWTDQIQKPFDKGEDLIQALIEFLHWNRQQ